MNAPDTRIVPLTASELADRLDEALDVHVNAMRYPKQFSESIAPIWTAQTRYDGWRCFAAVTPDDHLVGIGFGSPGRPGQWWYDSVHRAVVDTMGTAEADGWTSDYFGVTELHVHRQWQGCGLGRTMMRSLLTGLPNSRVLLSTSERPGQAWKLYRRMGFTDVLRDHRFPGDPRPFAVLGRPLPL